jgi:hypothetical protein
MLPPANPTQRGDRRTQRSELTSSWSVYHPEKAGVPIRKEQLEALEDQPVGSFVDKYGMLQRGKPKEAGAIVLENKTGDETQDSLLLALAAKQSMQ